MSTHTFAYEKGLSSPAWTRGCWSRTFNLNNSLQKRFDNMITCQHLTWSAACLALEGTSFIIETMEQYSVMMTVNGSQLIAHVGMAAHSWGLRVWESLHFYSGMLGKYIFKRKKLLAIKPCWPTSWWFNLLLNVDTNSVRWSRHITELTKCFFFFHFTS